MVFSKHAIHWPRYTGFHQTLFAALSLTSPSRPRTFFCLGGEMVIRKSLAAGDERDVFTNHYPSMALM